MNHLLTRRVFISSAASVGLLASDHPASANEGFERPPGVPPDLPRPEAMRMLLGLYEAPVRKTLDEIIGQTAGEQRLRLQNASPQFILKERAFEFYAEAGDVVRQRIVLSLGGLSSLEICAIAFVISMQNQNDLWWFSFLLYHRGLVRKQSDALWIEPGVAAFGDGYNQDEAKKLAVPSEHFFSEMRYFILAHEAAHVAFEHKASQLQGETQEAWRSRLREQELQADKFAIETSLKGGISAFSVSYTIICHLILAQDDPAGSDLQTHPADHERLLQAAALFQDLLKGEPEKGDFLNRFATHFGSPLSYFALDELAQSVSLGSLLITRT